MPDEGELDGALLRTDGEQSKQPLTKLPLSGRWNGVQELVRRGGFEKGEYSTGCNAAVWYAAKLGTIQTEAETLIPPISGYKVSRR